jgi:hypothetical protein
MTLLEHMRSRSGRRGPRRAWRFAMVAAIASVVTPAVAQERPAAKGAAAPKSRVVTISEVTIVGRIQKPIAAVDVSRIQPKLTLAELRQPFLQGIEKAIYSSPF